MDLDPQCDLDVLHQGIVDAIKAQFPQLVTVEDYREENDRVRLKIPACLIELSEMTPSEDDDAGTDQLPVHLRFEARLILGFRERKAKRAIRTLAGTFAAWVHMNQFESPVEPAQVMGVYPDDFDPALDQFEVWRVEWQHLAFLGESAWKGEDFLPQTVMVGVSPDIGTEHEADYQDITHSPQVSP
tara:strand:- start:527 stop:1084 length:558 start_codon:yes stop_codon:yes gene_type:complete